MKKFSLSFFVVAVIGLILPRAAFAQPTIKPSKQTFAPNENIVVEYANPQGHVWDWIVVARPNDGDQTSFGADLGGKWSWQIGDLKSGAKTFGGLAVGQYEVRYISWDGGNNHITARQQFAVGNAPPQGASPVTPTPQPTPVGGQPKTIERTVNLDVPANKSWTATGVQLNPGDAVRIEASGSVEASKPTDARVFYHNVPPEGRDEFIPNEPFPLLRGLCLVGKVGSGHVLPVEKYVHILTAGTPYGTGELFLGINDDDVSDNTGAWKVKITVFARSTPPPTVAEAPAAPRRTNTAPSDVEIIDKIPANTGTASPRPTTTTAPPPATTTAQPSTTTGAKPPVTTSPRPTGTAATTPPATTRTPPTSTAANPTAAKASFVWVCDAPTIANGNGGTTWNPNFKPSATEFTFKTEAGAENTMKWTPPPLKLRAGDEVTLTMTSTANPSPYVGGHWNVNCLITASGDNGASSNPNWRATSPHSGTMKFAFNPTAMTSGNPQIQVSAGNIGGDGGPSTYVLVTWVYKKQADDGK